MSVNLRNPTTWPDDTHWKDDSSRKDGEDEEEDKSIFKDNDAALSSKSCWEYGCTNKPGTRKPKERYWVNGVDVGYKARDGEHEEQQVSCDAVVGEHRHLHNLDDKLSERLRKSMVAQSTTVPSSCPEGPVWFIVLEFSTQEHGDQQLEKETLYSDCTKRANDCVRKAEGFKVPLNIADKKNIFSGVQKNRSFASRLSSIAEEWWKNGHATIQRHSLMRSLLRMTVMQYSQGTQRIQWNPEHSRREQSQPWSSRTSGSRVNNYQQEISTVLLDLSITLLQQLESIGPAKRATKNIVSSTIAFHAIGPRAITAKRRSELIGVGLSDLTKVYPRRSRTAWMRGPANSEMMIVFQPALGTSTDSFSEGTPSFFFLKPVIRVRLRRQ